MFIFCETDENWNFFPLSCFSAVEKRDKNKVPFKNVHMETVNASGLRLRDVLREVFLSK